MSFVLLPLFWAFTTIYCLLYLLYTIYTALSHSPYRTPSLPVCHASCCYLPVPTHCMPLLTYTLQFSPERIPYLSLPTTFSTNMALMIL